MKKVFITVAVAAFTLTAGSAFAQSKTEATETTQVRSAENVQKEADALEKRIIEYTKKVEANKDQLDDYEGELKRIAGLQSKWEELTGKNWKEEHK